MFAQIYVRDRSGYEPLNQLRITEREELRDKTNRMYAARGTPQKLRMKE